MLELLVILLCSSILASGILAVCLNNLMAGMVSAGLSSLFAAVCYALLAEPDGAMAEASIGSGLSTLIFLYAIRKTSKAKERRMAELIGSILILLRAKFRFSSGFGKFVSDDRLTRA